MKKLILVSVLIMSISACAATEEVVVVEENDSAVEVEEVVEIDEAEEETENIPEIAEEGDGIVPQPPAEEPAAEFTMEIVATHSTQASCWSVIDGKVYDLTSWIAQHPGGAGNILRICGKDGSAAFSGQHGSNAQAKATLPNYFLSNLQ